MSGGRWAGSEDRSSQTSPDPSPQNGRSMLPEEASGHTDWVLSFASFVFTRDICIGLLHSDSLRPQKLPEDPTQPSGPRSTLDLERKARDDDAALIVLVTTASSPA